MKKFVSILLTLALLCTLLVPVSAENLPRSPIHRAFMLLIGGQPVLYMQVEAQYPTLSETATVTVKCDTEKSDYCETYSFADILTTTSTDPHIGMELLIPMRDADNFPAKERPVLTFSEGAFLSQNGSSSGACDPFGYSVMGFPLVSGGDAIYCDLLMRRYAGTNTIPAEQHSDLRIEPEHNYGLQNALCSRMHIQPDTGHAAPDPLTFDTSVLGKSTQTLLFDDLPILTFSLDVLSAATVKKYVFPDKLLRSVGAGLFCLTLPLYVLFGISAGWVGSGISSIKYPDLLPFAPIFIPFIGTLGGFGTFTRWFDLFERIKPNY